MSTTASLLDDQLRQHPAGNGGFRDVLRLDPPAPGNDAAHDAPGGATAASPPPAAPEHAHDLPSRIRMLIKAEGGASVIARRCGFSEGAVRNWRDGHSDISRERCVIIARTLGISLLWLVAGEGAMRADPPPSAPERPVAAAGMQAGGGAAATAIDPRLLTASLRLLQSYIGLVGGSLDPGQRACAVAELYELLGRAGEPGHADRMLGFHTALRERLHQRRDALVA
ncbi:YdaS family helix-turn-helix protein [Fulvimonas sp. R45]|uniref:YdaS family helix-turn-helix protein n=1 Tax=Fulvimonas sp. R45 TaxID=3045937 RepID=UPI0026603E52|nr:YdaS family helix-turn-helix protein [Fulvimonas sp. R45]MDO1529289.1 YdaS family helix-turn-helix protein [Fulvimonas sp. R45]